MLDQISSLSLNWFVNTEFHKMSVKANESRRSSQHRRHQSSKTFGDKFSCINPGYREKHKTDAYEESEACGSIDFGTNAAIKPEYIKVANRMDVEELYQVLVNDWKLETPRLIISVTGGAKNFSLRTRLKEAFRKSLIKAAECTGAWITTGGTHAGVMKHVGKAVKDYAAIEDSKKRVVTIGIAAWGVIHNNNMLLNNHPDEGVCTSAPKVYDADESTQGRNVVLDRNHSHFILVDDGTEEKYGGEIDLRTKLESHIKRQDVTIVSVIVQGGPGSIQAVAGSIDKKIPVVIVAGSGGWADVLAVVYDMDEKSVNTNVIQELLREYKVKIELDKLEEWTDMAKGCIAQKNLLSVFALDSSDSSKDLDIAILRALLKARGGSTLKQLELAIAWDRSDLARSHILTDDARIEKREIAEQFFSALQLNKHRFCKVFLDYGVDLKKYCTMERILKLYEAVPHLKKSKKDGIAKVKRLMNKYLGRPRGDIYAKKRPENAYCAIIQEDKMEDPYREIFQWAILANNRETAMHVWEYMSGSMHAAIMATKMLKKMASKRSNDHEKRIQMLADADKYELLAAGVLQQCFLKNQKKTVSLLIGSIPRWGGCTCLSVATEANDKHFVSRPGVRMYLDKVWMGDLEDDTSTFYILLAGVCPPFIFKAIRFDADDRSNGKGNRATEEKSGNDIEMHSVEKNPASSSRKLEEDQGKKKFTQIEKLIAFYNAPIVIFWMNFFSFLVYLILFATVILNKFSISVVWVTGYEYALLGWISTFLLEEVRQLANQKPTSITDKIKHYFSYLWNDMDLASLILFYIGFILRWHEEFLQQALVLYTLAFVTHCICIVHIFAVHPVLGPKIIMVGQMLKDLLFFLFILVVFLLAYGVASQALLYPEETNVGEIIVGIIYKPYWQIYGELFLDEVNYNPNLDDFTCSDDSNSTLPKCPQQSVIVPIISAIYLLFTNILLLNLLIAMFSYTFESVQRQSNEIWTFQRYNLLIDYCFRPPLVPPLIVLSHIYLFFAFLKQKRSSETKKEDNSFFQEIEIGLKESNLRKWEHWQAEVYMKKKREEDDGKRG